MLRAASNCGFAVFTRAAPHRYFFHCIPEFHCAKNCRMRALRDFLVSFRFTLGALAAAKNA
ncbi:MAG: hypothetical protein DBX55_00095 [Verrucomicrobia bacterium]|nr:MAG: hypothetical protein DBX55_00095 [Verrucomicrobiota bacterium]